MKVGTCYYRTADFVGPCSKASGPQRLLPSQRWTTTALALFASVAVSLAAATAHAAAPSAEQALQLTPIQKDVDYSQPTREEAAKCAIHAAKIDGMVGWLVEDPAGLTLRRFLDTNGDNVVDLWAYYKDGLEVYRDIDSDFNGKADQYRWYNTGGSRWGMDSNEDGRIDTWKSISAEEATAELVAALATRDVERFARLVLTPNELDSLGLGEAKTKQLAEKLNGLAKRFQQVAAEQKKIGANTKWLQFSATQPGVVPAGTDGSKQDIRVYENVMAILQTGNDHGQLQVGTLVEVGPVWRIIDLPSLGGDGQTDTASGALFFQSPRVDRQPAASGAPSEEMQQALAELEKADAAAAQATTPEEVAQSHARRADLLESIASRTDKPEDRAQWLRQLADTVSAAVQSGTYPAGVERLDALCKKLEQSPQDKELVAYIRFRQLTADYGRSIQAPSADFARIQTDWLKKLEDYVSTFPKSPDTAEAMLQLAIAQEFAGQEEEAKKWYGHIVSSFSDSPAARKAAGAIRRLDSVGKTLDLQGRNAAGGTVSLADYRGKIVLIQYWATWSEPCKQDVATLKDLLAKYGRSGFVIVGVNLDGSPKEMADFVKQNSVSWPQIFEEGGQDSRPATELGILTLPTMLLLDQQGRVVNRNIQAAEVEREIKRLLQ